MKVCFPVQKDEGVESKVYNHFGSSPAFVIVDTEERDVKIVRNNDVHHAHGACNPIRAIGGQQIDALVVGGIGGGALMKLNSLGVKVFEAEARTVRENLDMLAEKKLQEISMDIACRAHQGNCGH